MTTKLQLPFDNEWLVYWGGDAKKQNNHHGHQFEHYAIDFVIAEDMDSIPQTCEETESFGRDVLAVTDGTVELALDVFEDNPIGELDEYNLCGNYIVIKHAEKLFSVYYHLRAGSVRVKKGDKVKKGQRIAEVGNTGRTSQPHLHFGLMSKSSFQKAVDDEKVYSLKPHFEKITVNGQAKTNYSPIKNDRVSNG